MRRIAAPSPVSSAPLVGCLAAYGASSVAEALANAVASGRLGMPLAGAAMRLAVATLIALLVLQRTRASLGVARGLAGAVLAMHGLMLLYVIAGNAGASGRAAASIAFEVADVALLAAVVYLVHRMSKRVALDARDEPNGEGVVGEASAAPRDPCLPDDPGERPPPWPGLNPWAIGVLLGLVVALVTRPAPVGLGNALAAALMEWLFASLLLLALREVAGRARLVAAKIGASALAAYGLVIAGAWTRGIRAPTAGALVGAVVFALRASQRYERPPRLRTTAISAGALATTYVLVGVPAALVSAHETTLRGCTSILGPPQARPPPAVDDFCRCLVEDSFADGSCRRASLLWSDDAVGACAATGPGGGGARAFGRLDRCLGAQSTADREDLSRRIRAARERAAARP